MWVSVNWFWDHVGLSKLIPGPYGLSNLVLHGTHVGLIAGLNKLGLHGTHVGLSEPV